MSELVMLWDAFKVHTTFENSMLVFVHIKVLFVVIFCHRGSFHSLKIAPQASVDKAWQKNYDFVTVSLQRV